MLLLENEKSFLIKKIIENNNSEKSTEIRKKNIYYYYYYKNYYYWKKHALKLFLKRRRIDLRESILKNSKRYTLNEENLSAIKIIVF